MCPHNIFFTIGHPSFCLLCTDIYNICPDNIFFTIGHPSFCLLSTDIYNICPDNIFFTIRHPSFCFLCTDIYNIFLTTSFLQLHILFFFSFVQIHGSLAAIDGRLKMDDRVLEINGQDVSYGTQEQAAALIVASAARVQFVVARRSRPQTPDIIRSASGESSCGGSDLAGSKYSVFTHSDDQEKPVSPLLFICQEKIVTIHKVWVCFRACVSIKGIGFRFESQH